MRSSNFSLLLIVIPSHLTVFDSHILSSPSFAHICSYLLEQRGEIYQNSLLHSFLQHTLKQCWIAVLFLHMKIICWIFHIKTPFNFWDMCTWDMWKVCLQTFRNNRICQQLAYFLRSLQTSLANNSRILRIQNVKLSGYFNILGDFQICISVLLRKKYEKFHPWPNLFLLNLTFIFIYFQYL